MTRYIDRPADLEARETRVRLPKTVATPLFQGWGPKF
jgi:hypothetical protein